MKASQVLKIVGQITSVLSVCFIHVSTAQFVPHGDQDVYPLARAVAMSALASDAQPFLVLFTQNTQTGWEMDPASGKATQWVIGFHSRSRDSAITVTMYQALGDGVSANPFPMARVQNRLDTLVFPSEQWISSAVALERIQRGLGQGDRQSTPFYAMLFLDRNDGVFKWVYKFTAGGDSISCWVNAMIGESTADCGVVAANTGAMTAPGVPDLDVWPNPVSLSRDPAVVVDYASSPKDEPVLHVRDGNGKDVMTQRIPHKDFTRFGMMLSVELLPPGTYEILVKSKTSETVSRKLTVAP